MQSIWWQFSSVLPFGLGMQKYDHFCLESSLQPALRGACLPPHCLASDSKFLWRLKTDTCRPTTGSWLCVCWRTSLTCALVAESWTLLFDSWGQGQRGGVALCGHKTKLVAKLRLERRSPCPGPTFSCFTLGSGDVQMCLLAPCVAADAEDHKSCLT